MNDVPHPRQLGRYEIVRELGHGAMGVVYEGRDPNINRRVAIKTARRDLLEDRTHADELMERFLQEPKAAGGLNHPNIVTIFDADEVDGTAYIAMEYLEGGSLTDYLHGRLPLKPEDAVEIAATICNALDAAHRRRIYHRDVKPDNVMLAEDGTLKLTDFGIARVEGSDITKHGSLVGTPYYMSPEQFTSQHVDGRADLFAVAVMLYEMVTGEKPFRGNSFHAVSRSVTQEEPVKPSELNFVVPDALERVILKALQKKRDKRYKNGHAMALALRESVKPDPNPRYLRLDDGSDPNATDLEENDPEKTLVTSDTSEDTLLVDDPARGSERRKKHAEIETRSGDPPWIDNKDTDREPTFPGRIVRRIALGVGAVVGIAALTYIAMPQPSPNRVGGDVGSGSFAEDAPSFAKLLLSVYKCDDIDQFNEYKLSDRIHPGWETYSGENVTIQDLESESLLTNGIDYTTEHDGDHLFINFEKAVSKIKIEITDGSYQNNDFLYASKPNHTLTRTLVLLKEERMAENSDGGAEN